MSNLEPCAPFSFSDICLTREFRYSDNGTFTLTSTSGASATLTFNGTAVWIYGAMRSNHGPYNVTLDGQLYQDNGYYGGDIFQQVLFSAADLDGSKPHTLSIINSPANSTRSYLDVDSVSIISVTQTLKSEEAEWSWAVDCLSNRDLRRRPRG